MRYFKKLLIALVVLSVVGTFFSMLSLAVEEQTQYPSATKLFYINDYSSVFTQETEEFILQQALSLQQRTDAQIVVVSVPDTQADDLEHYSLELANRWGIGDAEKNNGVLILFTTEEPHVRMEVGRGLEGCLPDGKAGRILDEWAVEAKNDGRWNEAAINTFVAVARVIYEEYGIQPPQTLESVEQTSEQAQKSSADASVPPMLEIENTKPFFSRLLEAFVYFWATYWVLGLITAWVLIPGGISFCMGSMLGGGSGRSFGGGSFGGWSGGGGSFGGGGASR